MEGVTYTGNYTTAGSQDGYNPYKYTTKAPFGSESFEPEPLNIQGAVGIITVLLGIVLFNL